MNKISGRNIIFVLLIILLILASCSGGGSGLSTPYDGRETADLSGYESMKDYSGESRLVDTSVAEIKELMDEGESFVFFCSYEDCPYCSRVIPYINDALAEYDINGGYLNTRKDPEWLNNTDITDYDVFVDTFGEYLDEDDKGEPHLYVPHLFVIKNGSVTADHQGVIDGADDPEQPLTEEQEEALRGKLRGMFDELK